MAVVAMMPSASDRMATTVNAGVLASPRAAKRRSRSICPPLPDTDTCRRRPIETVRRLDPKGVDKGVHVTGRGVGPQRRRKIWKHVHGGADVRVALLRPPHPRPRHEEALFTGEAVDHRRLRAFQRYSIRTEGDGKAANVRG